MSNLPSRRFQASAIAVVLDLLSVPHTKRGRAIQHGNRSISLSLIPIIRHNSLLIVNSQLESRRTPINKLNSPPCFNRGNSLVCITRNNISSVEKCTSHVVRCTRITNNHLIVWFETLECDVLHAMGFVLGFCFGDYGCAGDERIVDAWVGN